MFQNARCNLNKLLVTPYCLTASKAYHNKVNNEQILQSSHILIKFIERNQHFFLYWRQVGREFNSQQAYIMFPYHDWQYRHALIVICNVSQLRWWIINHVSSNGPDGPLHSDGLPLILAGTGTTSPMTFYLISNQVGQ